MRLFISIAILFAGTLATAQQPKQCSDERQAILDFLHEEGYQVRFVEMYPREEGFYSIRFYPRGLRCLGKVQVFADCSVIDAGESVLDGDGLGNRTIYCWEPDRD